VHGRVGLVLTVLALAGAAPSAAAGPTRSSPIAVASGGASGDVVFVVNPDSDTVARLEFDAMHASAPPLVEATVGKYPRTLALAGSWVFTADQRGDDVTRLDAADLGGRVSIPLGAGCEPYGVAPTPDGGLVVATCQGRSELVLIDPAVPAEVARVKLPWPNARAIAVSSAGARAYVTHYLTEEPATDAHVSVVDLANRSVDTVFAIPADVTTCETQNSGQGPLNLVSSIALLPDDAPPPVRNQLWVGGTQENNVSKGLFKRFPRFAGQPGTGLFPLVTFTPFPEPATTTRKHRKPKPPPFPGASATRNKYKASFHDITRFGVYKLDATSGQVVGKLDIDEANTASDIEFSADGAVAYVVDVMFNSVHVFSTAKGQGGDVTTLFAPPSAYGPGGADPTKPCVSDALKAVAPEAAFRVAPQAQLTVIDGYNPVDVGFAVVNSGVDFDTPAYMATGVSQMRAVPDGVGTAPIGVRLSTDGSAVFVANYLARNVVVLGSAAPVDAAGRRRYLRCSGDVTRSCDTNNDCPRGQGFCNHPGGPACTTDADCGSSGPCLKNSDCVPLFLGPPVASIGAPDPVPPAVLDGKILFNTAARDGSRQNQIGLSVGAPPFDEAESVDNHLTPGSVVSTSHDASYVTCSTCHADFGGQDGRTWDFSQFGASLRNTMDLRGRPGFAPGRCSNDAGVECFFDAACSGGGFCRMRDDLVPPNVPPADRARYFNPMLTVHWNGDRDEVEDFEHTYRSLMGAGDCDGFENDPNKCLGALIQRSALVSTDPVDVNADLGSPNRNIRGIVDPTKIVGIRLTHMADFVYSLTDFVTNPNAADDALREAAERGRRIFNDSQTRCAECHNSIPLTTKQFFTDKRPKRPNEGFDATQPAAADANNPFLRHDVGTGNLFDQADPNAVAVATQSFQNAFSNPPIPARRGVLGEYVTPVLNDLWNTRPYLHDGTAPFLLDVVRPCDPDLDDCLEAGRGRNVKDRHGTTSILTPQQLNDLTAFQKTLTADTAVGVGDRVVNAGALELARATVVFAKRRAAFRATGLLGNAPASIDPEAGVALTVATPGGEEMVLARRTIAVKRRGRAFSGRTGDGRESVTLVLRDVGGGRFRFAARGSGPDIAALDTGNRDFTVALEIGGVSFVQNRNLAGKRHVFRIARRKR
jgi:DNA-binding beta-propeller fold protein YncE